MSGKSFYITTTLPYVNAEPHVGFGMELVRADVMARYKKALGYDVFFNTGTDEHGTKLWQGAEKEGIPAQDYVDKYSQNFRELIKLLSLSSDINFIRTTDEKHIKAAQELWRICSENGYIYKSNYKAKYCVGCELEKTDSDLNEKGECPIHPGKPVETIDEENYFFKFSEFQKPLLELYERNPFFVVPDFRFNEVKNFVLSGLQDFSISRQKSKMPWGIAVPGDEDHVMYVWFDALTNYISALGWPKTCAEGTCSAEHTKVCSRPEEIKSDFCKFWINGTPFQYCGKDNLRQQSAMWQAMLLAVGIPNTHRIFINGFFTGEGGIKMSKSIGNVIAPSDVVSSYGADAFRFFVINDVSLFEDSPFTIDRLHYSYNANLSNGIGNLASRVLTLTEKYNVSNEKAKNFLENEEEKIKLLSSFEKEIDLGELQKPLSEAMKMVKELDGAISLTEPYKLITTNEKQAKDFLEEALFVIAKIAVLTEIYMPESIKKLKESIISNKKPENPIFARIVR